MKQRFVIDFSIDKRRFQALKTYSLTSFSLASSSFAVAFNHRAATTRLKTLLESVSETPIAFSIRFCDIEEMRQTNLRFRGKNKPTDVLSFCHQQNHPFIKTEVRNLGDILVCVPVCAIQAKRSKTSLSQEVERMIVHGLTHLIGFDHERSHMAWKVQAALEKSLRDELSRLLGKPTWCEMRKPQC